MLIVSVEYLLPLPIQPVIVRVRLLRNTQDI